MSKNKLKKKEKTLRFQPLKLNLGTTSLKAGDFNVSGNNFLSSITCPTAPPTQTPVQQITDFLQRVQNRPPFTELVSMKTEDFKFSNINEAEKGCYGTVFQCRHTDFPDLPLAMKVIQIQTSERELRQIKRELEIISKVNHENIVVWYGSTVDLSKYGVNILMEFVDGPTMQSAILLGGRFPFNILKYVLKSSVSALLYLKNELKVAHRDVKPSNILFSKAGVLKLVDFGMSRILEQTDGVLHTKFVGARSYMSPEMLGASEEDNYYQSDLFSLATTILECCFGFYPYPLVDEDELVFYLNECGPLLSSSARLEKIKSQEAGFSVKELTLSEDNATINTDWSLDNNHGWADGNSSAISSGKETTTSGKHSRPRKSPSLVSMTLTDDSKNKKLLERNLNMTPFEILQMLGEIEDTTRFPGSVAEDHFSQEFCQIVDAMCLHNPSKRISYEKIMQDPFIGNISVPQIEVAKFITTLLSFK